MLHACSHAIRWKPKRMEHRRQAHAEEVNSNDEYVFVLVWARRRDAVCVRVMNVGAMTPYTQGSNGIV